MKKPLAPIPVADVAPQQRQLRRQLRAAFERVMASGHYILGPEGAALEKELAAYLGVKQAVGVASGSDALELALRSLELPAGSEVIVPANVYPTVWGVSAAGVKVVPCDIDPLTWQLSLADLERCVSPKTKAVVVVHLYGHNSLSSALENFLKHRELVIIEDVAQALGAKRGRQYLGSIGQLGIYSFYPTKPLGAYGDGGLVAAKDKTLAQKLRELRQYGEAERYHSRRWGKNSRLDELQAALLREKLPLVEPWRLERREQADRYRESFQAIKGLVLPQVAPRDWNSSAHHLFPIRTNRRDELRDYLAKQGIGTAVHYPVAVSQLDSLGPRLRRRSCPVAEKLSSELLSLPLYNGLKLSDQKRVIRAVRTFFAT